MNYKVMPKKHLTSKVLDQRMHAIASTQSNQGLWVFTVEKDMKYGAKTYDQQSSRSARACASAQFEQDLCLTPVLSGTLSLFHWTCMCRFFYFFFLNTCTQYARTIA